MNYSVNKIQDLSRRKSILCYICI